MLALSAAAVAIALLNAGTAWAGKPKPPHIVIGPDGETAAVFSYANAIRERVFIPVAGRRPGRRRRHRPGRDRHHPARRVEPGLKVPAIIDPSPYYTSVGRGNESQFIHTTPAGDLDKFPLFYDNYFVPRGYAVILAAGGRHRVLDRLPAARRARRRRRLQGRDRLAAGRMPGFDKDGNPVAATWDNGKNAMIGKSYDGTFANGVASTGVEGLTTIVPISAISDWYDYSRMSGIRFNTHYPAILSNTITQNVGATTARRACRPTTTRTAPSREPR